MQLVLPVLQSHDFRLDNFIAGQNEALLEHVDTCLKQKTTLKPITYLQGIEGVGKTHLLLAFHHLAQSLGLSSQYIDMQQLKALPPQIIEGLAEHDVVCIDNLDTIAKHKEWQVQIFDTINIFLDNENTQLIVSANDVASKVGFTLPDLVSRLQWGTTFGLHELPEAQKLQALQMHFCERGINVQNEVIVFLMRRCERSMHKLTELVDQLDKLSLQKQRKLTIPFVKEELAL
jgi:DnaA family protein